jgi:hypothetical protein
MQLKLAWLNCFLLVLPLLAWNIFLRPKITDQRITSDAHSQKWLLLAENVARILVFALPIFLPLEVKNAWSKAGLAVYILGTLIYFTSWLPLILAPHSAWSNSPNGLLAPRLTPFLSFLGIAMIGSVWPYCVAATGFIFLHTWHGIQNL